MQARLFDAPQIEGAPEILINENGTVSYDRYFLEPAFADRAYDELLQKTRWAQEYLKMYGRRIAMPRLSAWYGDAGASYTYSGVANQPITWLPILRVLRERLYRESNVRFDSVLLNLYRSGDDSVSWHADDEPELGVEPIIASISLGASRKFQLRSLQSRRLVSVVLEHGSLLMMSGETQRSWQHRIPKQASASGARINLTFRIVRGQVNRSESNERTD